MKVNYLSDSPVGVFISPLEGESCFVVMADIAHDLSVEVGLGFEDTACNEVSLDLGEPNFDLIEPNRSGCHGVGRWDGRSESLEQLQFYESKGCRR